MSINGERGLIPLNNYPALRSPDEFFAAHQRWDSAMQSFIEKHGDIRFDIAKLKTHIMDLYQRYTSEMNIEGSSIENYINQHTRLSQFLAPQDARVNSAAFEVIKAIGWIFLNVVTLGIPSLIYGAIQSKKIKKLHYQENKSQVFISEQAHRAQISYDKVNRNLREQENLRHKLEEHQRERLIEALDRALAINWRDRDHIDLIK